MCSSLIAGLPLSRPPFPVAVVIVFERSNPLTNQFARVSKSDFHYTKIFRTHLVQPILFFALEVVGLLNSAHECSCPSLLDFLFLDHPFLVAVVIVVEGFSPIDKTICTCFQNRFSLHKDISNPSRAA